MSVIITMDFDSDDNPVISVSGAKGKSCKDLTKGLEDALGTVVEDTPTREFHETGAKDVRPSNNRR